MKKEILFILAMVLFNINSLFSQDFKIAWVSENITADQSYISLLSDEGYNVNAVENYWKGLTATLATELNAYDLVIISKRTNSTDYGSDATVRANWQNVTTPIINMNNYINRSSRLEFFNTTVNNDNVNYLMIAESVDHPIFTNTTLDTDNKTLQLTTEIYQGNDATNAGNGTVLASAPDNGIVTIAEWEAGKACYEGAGVQAGKRMWYACSYSYNFTEAGTTLFLNSVEYMLTGSVTDISTEVENPLAQEISIYPNPASNFIIINSVEDIKGSIFSVSGKLIKTISNTNNNIDISDLNKGVYIINIQSKGKIYTQKFIKK